MDKICRSVTTLYRIPKISHLNLRLNSPSIATANYNYKYNETVTFHLNHFPIRSYNSQKPPSSPGLSGAKIYNEKRGSSDDQSTSIVDILDREIRDESAQLNQQLSTDQFPGFSVETDDADVKLTKQIGNSTVTVRFTVSSSLNEWPNEDQARMSPDQQEEVGMNTSLISMPEFQVQISKNKQTLELSCYFEEMDMDEESGEPYGGDPVFGIDEIVLYEGEPKETEFAVSADYFQDDLQSALLKYLGQHGIDDEFAKDLVEFATRYEKKQYISLMNRLKNFVAK